MLDGPADLIGLGGASWRRWRYLIGVAVCLLFAWIAFVRKAQLPLLSLVDLGFHELSHLVTRPPRRSS